MGKTPEIYTFLQRQGLDASKDHPLLKVENGFLHLLREPMEGLFDFSKRVSTEVDGVFYTRLESLSNTKLLVSQEILMNYLAHALDKGSKVLLERPYTGEHEEIPSSNISVIEESIRVKNIFLADFICEYSKDDNTLLIEYFMEGKYATIGGKETFSGKSKRQPLVALSDLIISIEDLKNGRDRDALLSLIKNKIIINRHMASSEDLVL